MTFEELSVILNEMGVDTSTLRPSSPNQIQIPCVLAKWFHKSGSDTHPSLSIRYNDPSKPTLFKCFACKEQGKLWQLVDSYGNLSEKESAKKLALALVNADRPTLASRFQNLAKDFDEWVKPPEDQTMRAVHEQLLDRFCPAWSNEKSRNYLLSREVESEMTRFFDLRYDTRQNRILFPVRNINKELVGFVGRAIGKEQPRYYNYLNFMAGNTLGGIDKYEQGYSTKVILVEGFFDLLRCYKYWSPSCDWIALCSWRAEITNFQANLLQGLDSTIQVWYDQDTAGDKGYAVVEKLLSGGYGVSRKTWKENVDVGEMPKDLFFSILDSRKEK